MTWTLDHAHDTCEPTDEYFRHAITQHNCCDEHVKKQLDLELARAGESSELVRFRKRFACVDT